MRKTLFAASLASAVMSAPAIAADDPHTLTANVGLYSQYVFRGMAQTNEEPAIQGGFDYAHASGFYAGVWGSNVSWLKENLSTPALTTGTYSGGGSLELDLYAGFAKSFGDFGIDGGVLYYWYPGDLAAAVPPAYNIDADTTELYIKGSWKWLYAKVSYSLGDTFGVDDADGTYYVDLGASFPIGDTGLTVGAHYGIFKFEGTDPRNVGLASNDDLFSYDDWNLSVTYDLGKASKKLEGAQIGAMYTDTSSVNLCGWGSFGQAGTAAGVPCTGVYPTDLSDGKFVAWIKKTF